MTDSPPISTDSAVGSPLPRLVSLDAYRGLVMLLMASAGLGLATVAGHFPQSRVWALLARQSDHVRWHGCTVWDLIMPAFIFMVGAALPFSVASRRARGQAWHVMFGHAIWRSMLLVLLGIFVMSDTARRTNFNFINVLAQIGLGYWLAFLLVERSPRLQLAVLLVILAGYWYWFYRYPLPGASFDYASVGVPSGWHHLEGIAAHWDLNTNPASAFDRWFLNLFPRETPFRFRAEGGTTLNFIPAIATMLVGIMTGELLRSERSCRDKLLRLMLGGLLALLAGVALDPAILPGVESTRWSLCPIIKRLWTPSYVLYSAGWVVWAMAAFYWLIDVRGRQRWAFPLVVVGMNSIVMYLLAALSTGWIRRALHIHVGPGRFGGTFGPIVESLTILLILWLVCLWLYRRRIFIRI